MCAGQDPRTHLERFQECLLHGQPAVLSEKLEREAENNRTVSSSVCTAGQTAVGHTGTRGKGQLLTLGSQDHLQSWNRMGLAVCFWFTSERHMELLQTITMLRPHMKDLSLEFLAAKSVKNGSNQLLTVAFLPTRNFTCYRGLPEPRSL